MARPIHPGKHLAKELEALSMSAAELGRQLKVPTNRITEILDGQRAVTADTALRLAHFFGTSPQFWLNLQNLYDLRLAEQKAGKAIRSLPKLKPYDPEFERQMESAGPVLKRYRNTLRQLARTGYPEMAQDEAREREALAWSDELLGDAPDDLGTRLIRAAKEARQIARGEADPKTYRRHPPEETDA